MGKGQDNYWRAISTAFSSLADGLKITFRHLVGARRTKRVMPIMADNYFSQPDGISTIQYPHQVLPVPDNGRYRLHNEIDDCIVCDKCAKVCPVDCIDIEPIKATEEIGKTSDGTPKRLYAAKFDIDMAKCCFCGLCTTVCPTECLTMTKVYDFSVSDIKEHNFAFAEMSPAEIAEKKQKLQEQQKAKITTPVAQNPSTSETQDPAPQKAAPPKPVFKPKIKPPGSNPPAA